MPIVTLFCLAGSYEFFLDQKIVRIEIFESTSEEKVFRTRVWLQTSYNLYPTFLNLGQHGEDLKAVHSSDQINTEITLLVADSPEWITGISCNSKDEFLKTVLSKTVVCLENLK